TLQKDWQFIKGNPDNATQTDFDASGWESVTIPHDWAITGPFDKAGDGSTAKLPWKGQGWYRKSLDIKPEYKDQRIYLLFDG
ncbi:MAG: hypothetical protein V7767_03765, partial [Leeuwenhoekiella sp.]